MWICAHAKKRYKATALSLLPAEADCIGANKNCLIKRTDYEITKGKDYATKLPSRA